MGRERRSFPENDTDGAAPPAQRAHNLACGALRAAMRYGIYRPADRTAALARKA